MRKMDKKNTLNNLFWASVGVWVTCGFIAVCYDNSIPMWVALIVMNALYYAKQ